jgi:hypothetical protein
VLRPAPNDYLQRWPVSKLVNSWKDDATLIDPVELKAARPGCVPKGGAGLATQSVP